MVWYNYLFFDTSISVEGSISTNFGLPLPPGKLDLRGSTYSIKVNAIIYALALKIYSGEHTSIERLDKELMRARDLFLLHKAIEGNILPEELKELDSKISTLVQIRIQKFEIEGETDPWISRIQRFISGSHVFETEPSHKEVKEGVDDEEEKVNIPTEENAPQRHEFIDSDSDSDPNDKNELQNMKYKPSLSRIDEEGTEQLQPSTYNEMPGEKSPSFNSYKGSSATMKKMGNTRARNEPINTAGTEARSQTDYITQDSAMKNYIQKTLMAGLGDKLRKSSVNVDNAKKLLVSNSQPFGSAELDIVVKKLEFRTTESNPQSMVVIPKNSTLPIPLNDEEYYIGKKLDTFTPTLFKRKIEPKAAKIIEEDCSMSSDENKSHMEQKTPTNASKKEN
jgi:hypothetical protein